MAAMTKVLMILSAAKIMRLDTGLERPTGFWASEFIEPYFVFAEHGIEVDVATPGGKTAHPDPESLDPATYGGDSGRVLNLLEQLDSIEAWRTPRSLERLAFFPIDYDALFFPGGYGPVVDLAENAAVGNLIRRVAQAQGLIGAVCHGPAALLSAEDKAGWPFAGYRMTCYSPAEEAELAFTEGLDTLLHTELGARGAALTFASPSQSHTVIDRTLYTGQNPASAAAVAWHMARTLKKRQSLDKAACGTPCD